MVFRRKKRQQWNKIPRNKDSGVGSIDVAYFLFLSVILGSSHSQRYYSMHQLVHVMRDSDNKSPIYGLLYTNGSTAFAFSIHQVPTYNAGFLLACRTMFGTSELQGCAAEVGFCTGEKKPKSTDTLSIMLTLSKCILILPNNLQKNVT